MKINSIIFTRLVYKYNKIEMKIEHIGIAVKEMDMSNKLFERLLGKKHYKQEEVSREEVVTSFFKLGDVKMELLQGTSKESSIAKFVDKRGEGVHHLAFSVENIHAEVERLKAEGFTFINETPQNGADNKLIVFLHPKTTNGVLVELCQQK